MLYSFILIEWTSAESLAGNYNHTPHQQRSSNLMKIVSLLLSKTNVSYRNEPLLNKHDIPNDFSNFNCNTAPKHHLEKLFLVALMLTSRWSV